MKIGLFVTGRGYHEAAALPEVLELPEGTTVSEALARVDQLLPAEAKLSASCLVTVSGQHLGTRTRHADQVLRDGHELVLIAPVAGG